MCVRTLNSHSIHRHTFDDCHDPARVDEEHRISVVILAENKLPSLEASRAKLPGNVIQRLVIDLPEQFEGAVQHSKHTRVQHVSSWESTRNTREYSMSAPGIASKACQQLVQHSKHTRVSMSVKCWNIYMLGYLLFQRSHTHTHSLPRIYLS